ncbi:MAG TPA: hypothetical protein VI685_17970 [Candidatus Angelobacter sp.]
MKNHFPHAVLLVALAVLAMASPSTGQSSNLSNSSSTSAAPPQGTALIVELAKSVDAKKAKVGDPVKTKVIQDVISSGKLVIPRGSMVTGHVTAAKAYSQGDPQSILGVVFDKVALKHGQQMTFNAFWQALAPPVEVPDVLTSSDYDGGQAGGSQPVSHGPSRPLVDPRDRVDHTREDALRNASDPNSYGTGLNTLHNGMLSNGNRGVFGMPGVSFKSQSGTSAPELISTKASIKLESGTQMVLEIAGNGH